MKTSTKKKPASKKKTIPKNKIEKKKKEDIPASFNQFKEFEGKKYTGMKIGRSHKWYYDKGT